MTTINRKDFVKLEGSLFPDAEQYVLLPGASKLGDGIQPLDLFAAFLGTLPSLPWC